MGNMFKKFDVFGNGSSSLTTPRVTIAVEIDCCGRIDVVNDAGETALHLAARDGHVGAINILLTNNSQVNIRDIRKRTALHWASNNGYSSVVKLLLRNDASIDLEDSNGTTALHLATMKGHLDTVKTLLKNKANVELKTVGGCTALHLAALFNRAEIGSTLCEAGANVNNETNEGNTPLHFAAEENRIEVAEVLIGRGANANVVNNNGGTPLHSAARNGHFQVVKILVQAGANVDCTDEQLLIPLHLAACNGHGEIITLLLENKARINATCKGGYTPLHISSEKSQVDSLKTLLTFNPHVDAKDENENSPLYIAVKLGHFEIAEMLIGHGADVFARNKFNSVLHQAVKNVGILKLVLEEIKRKLEGDQEQLELALNVCSKLGNTPLIWAVNVENLKALNMLLELKETDINKQNSVGSTALNLAAEKGFVNIVEALLAQNPLLNVKNNENNSPLTSALRYDHFEVAKMLINNGADVLDKNDHQHSVLHLSIYNDEVFEITFDLILKQLNEDEGQLREVLNLQDENGDTPLMWAVLNKSVFITQTFLACDRIDINKQNLKGSLALHNACGLGHFDIAEILIKHGSDVFAKNKHDSVLHQAVNNADVLQLVLSEIRNQCERDADRLRSVLNAPDTEGDTPLMWAAQIGNTSSTKLLLECDEIDINRQNFDGWTAFHWAAHKGHLDIVHVLMDKMADVNIKDKNGETAFDLASHKLSEDKKYETIALVFSSVTDNSQLNDPSPPIATFSGKQV